MRPLLPFLLLLSCSPSAPRDEAQDKAIAALRAEVARLRADLAKPQAVPLQQLAAVRPVDRDLSPAVLAVLENRALDIERWTGRKVLDDQGRVIDPKGLLRRMKELSVRKHPDPAVLRRALMADFGVDAGLAVWRQKVGPQPAAEPDNDE